MDPQHIKEMIRALKPVLKDQSQARLILERYWRRRMAIVWTVEQVYRAANEIKVAVTKAQATQILQNLHRQHNPQLGLRWSDLTRVMEDSVMGRELTKRELDRFIHHDVITINQ